MCTSVLHAFMYVHHKCAHCPQRPEESVRSPGIRDDCELPILVLRIEPGSSTRATDPLNY